MGITYEQRQQIKKAWSDNRKKRLRGQRTREDEVNLPSTRLKSSKDWAEEGLEEVEPGDPKSQLQCMECGKVTDRNRGVPRRHHSFCSRWVPRRYDKETKQRA